MAGRVSHPEELIRDWVEIPTLPQVIARLGRLIDDPDVGLRDIGAVVAEDPPLASQVLRTANSAYYGFAQRVVSLEHAATLLGGRILRNIVLQASVMKLFAHVKGAPGLDLELLWRHSILTGQLCWTVAFRCRTELGLAPEEFYVIGAKWVFEFDITTWGWIHMILGAVMFAAGIGILSGNVLARAVGVILAAVSAVANFAWLPYYPVWSIVMIFLAIAVIWALTVHGRDVTDA